MPRESPANPPSELQSRPGVEAAAQSRTVLVIGHEIGAGVVDRVKRELGPGEAWLVSPTLARNRLEHLVSDIDDQVEEADGRLQVSERSLRAAGVTVAGRGVGDADPLLAIEDVLNAYPAERILLVTHSAEESRWAEADLFEKATERFGLPVRNLRVAEQEGDAPDAAPRVADTRTAAATDGDSAAELAPSENMAPIPVSDAVGLTVGVVGTIVLAILAATSPGPFLGWPGSAQLALAIYSALVNLGHVVGLLLMDSVGFRRGPQRFFAWLSLVGTPIAVLASIVIGLVA